MILFVVLDISVASIS